MPQGEAKGQNLGHCLNVFFSFVWDDRSQNAKKSRKHAQSVFFLSFASDTELYKYM